MFHEKSRRGPAGSMLLLDVTSESGSEHLNEYWNATLKADGDQVALVETSRTTDAINGNDDTRENKYGIAVDVLIDFIKSTGNQR